MLSCPEYISGLFQYLSIPWSLYYHDPRDSEIPVYRENDENA